MEIKTNLTLAELIVEFFNRVDNAYEIRYQIKDDYNFSSPSAPSYGITLSTCNRIIEKRNRLGGAFKSLEQIRDVDGIGPVTFHNILFSFQEFPMKGDVGGDGPQGPEGRWGYAGRPGPRGDRGLRGYTGPQGYKGTRGPQGLTGEQGERGEKGDVGPIGPKGNGSAASLPPLSSIPIIKD